MRVGSLFAGIGGIDLGLERAGMECRWQVEIEEYPRRVLEKHWPDVTRYRDVRDVGADNLEPVDLIAGGFPCQDISYAGKGAGLEGERSGLWYEFARVVREMGPRYVLVENVAALTSRGLDAVLGTLASFGYDAEWEVIPAAAVGAPHRRERTFVVGYTLKSGLQRLARDGADRVRQERQVSQPDRPTSSSGLRGRTEAVADPGRDGRYWSAERHLLPKTRQQTQQRHDANRRFDTSGRLDAEAEGERRQPGDWWLSEPDVGRVADGVPARVDRIKGLGNAVVPQVAEWIGRRIMEADAALREADDAA